MQIYSTLSGINLTSSIKISEKKSFIFQRKWCFSDFMFRLFGSKGGRCLKTSRMYRFEAKCNSKTQKDVKLNVLQSVFLRTMIFFHFDPKTHF